MPYKLTDSAWLAQEVAKVRGTLLHVLEKGESYTVAEILQLLKDRGLDYTNPAYAEIGAALIDDGTIESV